MFNNQNIITNSESQCMEKWDRAKKIGKTCTEITHVRKIAPTSHGPHSAPSGKSLSRVTELNLIRAHRNKISLPWTNWSGSLKCCPHCRHFAWVGATSSAIINAINKLDQTWNVTPRKNTAVCNQNGCSEAKGLKWNDIVTYSMAWPLAKLSKLTA